MHCIESVWTREKQSESVYEKTIALAKQKGYSDLREFVNQKKAAESG